MSVCELVASCVDTSLVLVQYNSCTEFLFRKNSGRDVGMNCIAIVKKGTGG